MIITAAIWSRTMWGVGVGGIFVWLSGANRKVIGECPTERPKYFGLGAVIVVTGAMAGVSLAFALVNALKISLSAAIVFAVFWGLAIMMIDRLFVTSMHRQRNPLIYLIQALPRLLMAVVLGFVISTPFVLQIFKPEITSEVQQMQAAQRSAYFKGLPSNPLYLAVQTDQRDVNALKTQAASGGTPTVISNDPQVKTWTTDEANANAKVQYWTGEQNCQLYGGSNNGTPCHAGYGPVAHNDQSEINYWSKLANTYNQDIASRTGVLEGQDKSKQAAAKNAAKAQLPSAKQTLNTATAQLDAQTRNVTSGINGNDGILEQLKALGAVTAHNFTLQMARVLLFLLFLFIDIMPVFVKLLMNLMPASNYDKILVDEEALQLRLAENIRAVRQRAHYQAVQAEAAGVRHRNTALSAPLPGQREKILGSRQRVEEEWLRKREAEQLHDVASGQGFVGIGSVPHADGSHLAPGEVVGSHFGRPWNINHSRAGQRRHDSSVPSAAPAAGAWGGPPPAPSDSLWRLGGRGASRTTNFTWTGSLGVRFERLVHRLRSWQRSAQPGPLHAPQPSTTQPPAPPREPGMAGWAGPPTVPEASPRLADPNGSPAHPDPRLETFPAPAGGDGLAAAPVTDFIPTPAHSADQPSPAVVPGISSPAPREVNGGGQVDALPEFGYVPLTTSDPAGTAESDAADA